MQNILTEAKQISTTIAREYKPQKIILFGSAARGNTKTNSDIDLLIIKPSNKKKPYRAKEIFKILRNTPRDYPLDLIVYTPEELEKRLALGDYFIKRIFTEGKILYG